MQSRFFRTDARLFLLALLALVLCTTTLTSAQSVVVNGDFSSGNSGFNSDYSYVAPTPNALHPEGLYTVHTNPHDVHNNWITSSDHTGDGAAMMFIANGATSTSQVVWQGTVNMDLSIGTTYDFSAWILDVLAGDPAPPTLTFKADGVTIGTYSSGSTS